MPLIANELLSVIGKALIKLSEALQDGDFSAKEQADLFQTIITELIKEYYD